MDAQPKHDKAVFVLGMVFIIELSRVFIKKYGLCFLKRNAVFPLIGTILPWIPFKLNHTYNIFTSYVYVNGK